MGSDNEQKDSYWKAQAYHDHSEPQFNWAMDVLKHYHFKGMESVLDVGCGSGRVTAFIANKVPHGKVLGIDLTADMIRFAKELYGNIPNLTFKQSEARYFNSGTQYDLITSFNVLHWIYEQEETLIQLYKHLIAGGTLLLSLGRPIQEPYIHAGISATMAQEPFAAYFQSFDEGYYMPVMVVSEYQKLLEKIGFDILYCKETVKTIVFENPETFALWLQPLFIHTTYLPRTMQTDFYLAIAKYYAFVTQQRYNNIAYHYHPWEVKARKK